MDKISGTDHAWHALVTDEVAHTLGASPDGLSAQEAADRLALYGPNALQAQRARPAWQRFLLQFHNLMIYVLIAAALTTAWLQDFVDTGVIVGVVLINAVIGFIQEGKAEQALEAVRSMLAQHAVVIRGGVRLEVAAEDLVPGDLVAIESGAKVPADLRLFQAKNLQINEAALTGESVSVSKSSGRLETACPLAERTNMAFAGTVVDTGQGLGWVVATAAQTEVGRIGQLVGQVGTTETPLTKRLDQMARQVTLFILVLSVLTFAYGWWMDALAPLDMFLAVVGLAVAAIPEGLPAVVTITLAIGTAAMASRKAIVRRLPSVETLGSVSVICTDKTGTLTRNEMTVVRALMAGADLSVDGTGYAPEGHVKRASDGCPAEGDEARQGQLQRLARCAVLCNDAELVQNDAGQWTLTGDPTEGALLTFAAKAGMEASVSRAAMARIDSIPFESERQYMAALHRMPGDDEGGAAGHPVLLLKGSPEKVLDLCSTDATGRPLDKAAWHQRMEAAAGEGWRLLALAETEWAGGSTELDDTHIRGGFTLLGVVAMMDPPRPEAIAAVQECQEAGVRVIMITGDHASTAGAIGRQMGLRSGQVLTGSEIDGLDERQLGERLSETDVVARATPEHKLRLIASLQAQGRFVAMTGDGVNDAPALKAADIGVAMGGRGTDAAREAADLVLTDDNFSSIAAAVREGRRVFDNIKKTLLFILPTNGGEAGLILLAVLAGWALPITAGQILWINMVTSVTLDLALAFEPAERGVMQRPPRPAREPLITPVLFFRLAYVTTLMLLATWAVYEWEMGRHGDLASARTAVVNMLAFSEMFYLFNVRRFTESGLTLETWTGNRIALLACAVTFGLQLLFTYAPPLQSLFGSVALGWDSWALIVALATGKFLAVELEKSVLRRLGLRYL